MQTVAAYAGMAICARKLPSGRRPPRRCRATLDALLVRGERATTTPFHRLKQMPGPLTTTTLRLWVERLDHLELLPNDERPFAGIAHTKLRQLTAEAAAKAPDRRSVGGWPAWSSHGRPAPSQADRPRRDAGWMHRGRSQL